MSRFIFNSKEEEYIAHVKASFSLAERGVSGLIPEILDMEGMTGIKTRHLYNNLLNMEDVIYLEIGCWKGSSLCSALFGNHHAVASAIDDFSGFGSPKEEFWANFRKYCDKNVFLFHEVDCFSFELKNLSFQPYNIFLADADHSEESQRKIIEYYLPVMQEVFILIVDDVNWPEVRIGTQKAIEEANLKVLYHKEIRTTNNNQFPDDQEMAKNTWWNGIAVFILKKP